MATRTFLSEHDSEHDKVEALRRLTDGYSNPAQNSSGFSSGAKEARRPFALWLQGRLMQRLQSMGDFVELKPVLVGSWARDELCPKSDIDLLFLGDEARVKEFVARSFAAGLKLRARTPLDLSDWTGGVEPFDVLALLTARPAFVDPELTRECERQKARILGSARTRATILRALRRERETRRRRQDSVSNYLEPNLKYGAGGLRDIEQALSLRTLFSKRFAGEDPYPFEVLGEIKDELLFLRTLLHLSGGGDILAAHDQMEMAKQLGFISPVKLMTFVQSQLERASFYADWVTAYSGASAQRRAQEMRPPPSLSAAIDDLKRKPTVLRQFSVRRHVRDLFGPLSPRQAGKMLHAALHAPVEDSYLVALHRTRLLEGFLPDLVKIRGLVQHDHYHRFTADAHLVQTLREVQRAQSSPRSLGKLKILSLDLTAQDWWTLKLTALFHDLAKGGSRDHAGEGAKLVDRYFSQWQFPESMREDVHWLVFNHLLLSTAAFRQNPQAQSTWSRLFERGVEGRRLVLLALFTAIDIRATNPEAWTDWKAQLLLNLVENLRSPGARSLQAHLKMAVGPRKKEFEAWLLQLDTALLELIPPKILLADLSAARKADKRRNAALSPKVVTRKRERRLWIRFHQFVDETGLFLRFVKRLYGLGLSVQMASVHTLPGIGVYDWFCVRTVKPARQIAKWLEFSQAGEDRLSRPPEVEFQNIDLMARDSQEWIISFRGRDQRGLLWAAAQALVEENLFLKWARVHTWGQQVDDVFGVRPLGESEGAAEAVLERLRRKFVT